MAITSLIPSFNSGELSPLIHLRSDLDKYRSGCRTLQNMLVTPFGGVKRRAGLAYFATATTRARLFRFQAAVDQGYILEFGDGYIRFFLNGIVKNGGSDYTVATPYGEDDLKYLQMVQVNSVAYFTHPAFPPYKLQRFTNTSWTFAAVVFSYPAMLEENLNRALILTTSGAGNVGDYLNVTASTSMFTANHLNAYFEISHERAANEFDVSLAATSGNNGLFSAPLVIQGAWSLITVGTWNGTFLIQRSTNGGASWETVRTFYSNSDANHSAGGTSDQMILLRLGWQHGGTGSSTPKATLSASGAFIRGLVRVNGIYNSMMVNVQVINAVRAGSTSYWREGAWSYVNGFPRTVCAHEQRIVYGGNALRPSTIWGSAIDDYERFEPGVNDSDSYTHTLASDQQNSIQWLVSQKALLIGTSGDEWVVASSGQDEVITPTNVRARRHSGNGSDFLKARVVNDAVLFVQRGGKKLRDMIFSFDADGYVTSDLTLLAEHIAGSGIIDTAYQAQPISTLWCVTNDGTLIGLTYDRAQQLVGWHRHTTGDATDGFESVAVRSTAGEADQVWVVVRRRIDGTDRRHVERITSEGFFLEEPWSELFLPIDGVELWHTDWESYSLGDVVLGPGGGRPGSVADSYWYCIASHTMDETWLSGGFSYYADPGYISGSLINPDAKWGAIFKWENSTSSGGWGVGLGCHHAGFIYECIAPHAATGAGPGIYEPGVTSGWASYWAILGPMPVSIPTVIVGEPYAINDFAAYDGKLYKSLDATHAVSGYRPDLNEYVWRVQQGTYTVGDLVSQGGRNYVCINTHTPSSGSKPGSGNDWGYVWALQSTDNLQFYVDSGVAAYDFTGGSMGGLAHLEGETVQVLANGAVLSPRLVNGGAIQFDQEGDPTDFVSCIAGLAYDSILEPMALEIGMQNGTSVSREKRIHELVIYFRETGGCKVSWRKAGPFDTLAFRTGDIYGDTPALLFSGPYLHKLEARHDMDASFVLKQDQPLPFQVLAVVPKFNVYGD